MVDTNRAFGEALTQGLKSIAASERKRIIALEDELGYDMDSTRWSIEKWRQGTIPSDSKNVDYLARACVRRGGMNKQWLVHFLKQARFPEQETLIQELFPGTDPVTPTVRQNLPRRHYEQFVGREDELAKIEKILSHRHRLGVVCLTGIGGVGKTALALEVAHRRYEEYAKLPPEERFEAIVWVTAKQAELLPAGLTARNPTFTDLSGVYRAIAAVLDLPAITRTVEITDREVIVEQALAERRILLILDNLEDIDDQLLTIFLRDLPAPSKAIVTTRHRIDIAAPIQVRPFNNDEALQLIRIESQRHNLTLTPEQEHKLLRIGTLPLAIVRTLGRMAWRESNFETELRLLGTLNNEIYDFCFKRSIDLIQGSDAYQLFITLALFATDAARDALGYVAGFQEALLDRDEGLSKLEILSLINKEEARFSLEPLTKTKALAELADHPAFEAEARERMIEWYKQLAESIKASPNDDYQAEITNMKNNIDWLIEQQRMDEVSLFFRRVGAFLFAQGRWGVLVRWAEHLVDWAEKTDNTELLADMLNPLTDIFLWQADFARGKELLERIRHLISPANEFLQARVTLHEIKLLCHRGTYAQPEILLMEEVIKVFRRQHDTEQLVEALKTAGNLHLKLHHVEDAMRYYTEGLQILGEASENTAFSLRRLSAALQGNIGHAIGMQGQFKEACDIYRDLLKEFTASTDLAEANASLALFEYRLGHIEQARHYRQRADRLIKQINLVRPICMEDEAWDLLSM